MTDDGRFDWRDCVGEYKLFKFVRSMSNLVMLLCALNVVARMVVAVYRVETAIAFDAAAVACDARGNDTVESLRIHSERVLSHTSNTNKSTAASRVLEATILVVMAGGFLLFFPACIVMFRRVERRLNSIIEEMRLRSDIGNVFLPFEFSPAADIESQASANSSGTVERTQVEMPVVQAREFLHRIKSAATAQRRRFLACMLIVPMALVIQAIMAVIIALRAFVFLSPSADPSCGRCDSCQSVIFLIKRWYDSSPELFALVSSLCSTLPLTFSLWLMMTKDDRAIMLHPHRFLPDQIALHPVQSDESARLKAERLRMGIELR
jgi:hypothetical protein